MRLLFFGFFFFFCSSFCVLLLTGRPDLSIMCAHMYTIYTRTTTSMAINPFGVRIGLGTIYGLPHKSPTRRHLGRSFRLRERLVFTRCGENSTQGPTRETGCSFPGRNLLGTDFVKKKKKKRRSEPWLSRSLLWAGHWVKFVSNEKSSFTKIPFLSELAVSPKYS